MARPLPPPEAERQMGTRQSQKARGIPGPRDSILYQTVSRLPVANQVFLGFWAVDIHQEGHSQRSAPQRRHTALEMTLPLHTQARGAETGEVIRHTTHLGQRACQAPSHLSWSDLGRAQNTGPTKSVPLWGAQEPEPEGLSPGKCMQPRACFRPSSPAKQPGA